MRRRGTLMALGFMAGLAVDMPATAQISPTIWSLCVASGNPDETIGACSALVEESNLTTGQLVAALSARGVAFYREGRYALAFADFARVVELAPGVAVHQRNLGDARGNLNRGSDVPMQVTRDLERALGDFHEAVRLDPKDPLNLVHRGDAYIALGRLDRGLDDLHQAVAMAPELAEARNSRGLALRAKGDFRRAVDDFNNAVRLQPDNAQYLNTPHFPCDT